MRPGTGVVVRLGRVLTGGDDRLEGGALGPAPAHGGVELEGEVLLGDALAHQREHLEEGGVGDGGGSLHAGDLGGVLALAERLDRVGGGHERVAVEDVGPGPLPRSSVTLPASSPMRPLPAGAERGPGGLALLGHGADGDVDLGGGTGPLAPARPTGCGSGRRW